MSRLSDVPTLVLLEESPGTSARVLARLFEERPAEQNWAVLLEASDEHAALAMPSGVTAVTVEAGCLCCVGAVAWRVALTRLLREAQPSRLMLVLRTAGHARAALRALRDPWLAPVIAVDGVVALSDGEPHSLDAATAVCVPASQAEAMRAALAARGTPVPVCAAEHVTLAALTARRS